MVRTSPTASPFSLVTTFKCIWHMSEHHYWRHICCLQNLFYTFSTQYQHSKYALFFPCNVFLIFSNFTLLLNLVHMHRYIQNMQYALCNLFHKLFNLALHCLYLFYLFIRILCYPSIALIVISQCIPPNCSILNLYSVPLCWGRTYDKSCIINSPPLLTCGQQSKGKERTLNPPTPLTPLPCWK